MIIKFSTESGSIYEVDQTNKCVRRITGINPAQPRQGSDNEWQNYVNITPIVIGQPVLFTWSPKVHPLFSMSDLANIPATLTSNIIKLY